MSRIGRKIIPLPEKVKVRVTEGVIWVEGPKGKLSKPANPFTSLELKDNVVAVVRVSDAPEAAAAYGTIRALVANMVIGVSAGFQKVLDINGVGYRAEVKGSKLHLTLGFSHPVEVAIPQGIKVTVDKQTSMVFESTDCELLGQFAADIRKLRPPEPYKGKGIKYRDEVIVRKVGKSAAK